MASSDNYPPRDLTPDEDQRLVSVIKDWSMAHGLCVRPPPSIIPDGANPDNLAAVPVPVTLFPSPFPELCFQQAVAVQKAYNELYARISLDQAFLAQMVKEIGESDTFIQELWKVHQRVKAEGYVQDVSLGLFRSDYMVHQESSEDHPQIKQVEFNTIASSFGGLSSQTSLLHHFLNNHEYAYLGKPSVLPDLRLPENPCTPGLASGIKEAFSVYGPPKATSSRETCVIFLVQDGERNIFDQRHLEYELQRQARPDHIPIFRLPFSDVLKRTSILEKDGRVLLYHPPHSPESRFEVAVVYMRSGYGPGDYPGPSAWEARYQIERSAAIKCPSVLTQIAGTKKVQQVLATPTDTESPSILHEFLKSDPRTVEAIQRTFTNIYPLDDKTPAGRAARDIASDPEKCKSYVLKPQREGGGNNVYRDAIPGFLASIPRESWDAYILMELIVPPPVFNTILRHGKLERGNVICELGVYGTCIWDSGDMRWNDSRGYLLRTKGDKSEEGGVAAGFGCMDSCAFVTGR